MALGGVKAHVLDAWNRHASQPEPWRRVEADPALLAQAVEVAAGRAFDLEVCRAYREGR